MEIDISQEILQEMIDNLRIQGHHDPFGNTIDIQIFWGKRAIDIQ